MHPSCWKFLVKTLAPWVGTNGWVLELGSRDLGDGSLRNLFPFAKYVGVDLVDGPGVDIVADAADWEPQAEYDVAISANTFEHAERWREIVVTARKALKPGGEFIVSCATDPCPPHSADGNETVPEGEWYENVAPTDLGSAMVAARFRTRIDTNTPRDLYAVGVAW